MENCLVTTTIPYVNALPHVGFALELVLADVYARWYRLRGRDTRLLTGTDDNATKNVRAADAAGEPVREFCNRHAVEFADLARILRISNDAFIRTSSALHHRGARRFFLGCREGDLYKKTYEGWYCVGCEDFYLTRDAPDGTCPIHGGNLERICEENWFFRLSGYASQLEELIASGRYRITPDSHRNEALGFIRGGLVDFSVSRNRARCGNWGVAVPGDAGQILYVWFDALTNYLNGSGYADGHGSFASRWAENAWIQHICGKDVLKFHGVYWPAMLLSAGLAVPHHLHVHGHLTIDGRKISKSLGNVVDPRPIARALGADALRYYLLRAVPSDSDSDFSEKRLYDLYNADLANGLGNLVARLEALAERSGYRNEDTAVLGPENVELGLQSSLSRGRTHLALAKLWAVVADLNREIEADRPWEAIREGHEEDVRLKLSRWLFRIRSFAHNLSPFLPDTSQQIAARFAGPVVSRGEPLFPRLRR